MGEGITEATEQVPEETPIAVMILQTLKEELDDQPAGEHEEQQVGPTPTATMVMASGSIIRHRA